MATDSDQTDFRKLPLLRYYEERRSYPRVDLRVDAILSTRDHAVLRARVRNVSADGLQIRCDPETASALHPEGRQISGDDGPVVVLRCELPAADGSLPFAAKCRLTYITARRPGEIAFGVKFVKVGSDDKKKLAQFMMDALRPD